MAFNLLKDIVQTKSVLNIDDQIIVENTLLIVLKASVYSEEIRQYFFDESRQLIMDGLFNKEFSVRHAFYKHLAKFPSKLTNDEN